MAETATLYGFEGSTYARTVRMVLEDKGVAHERVEVNVLEGETREPAHLQRHPFGKVPVLDIDGMRIRETEAICRYLDDTRPEPRLVPEDPKARATMTEAINLINSYGYDAMVGGAAYHLFPDFIGGKDDARHARNKADARTLLALLMENRGDAPWLAGDRPSLADYFLGPLLFYTAITPDKDEIFAINGVQDYYEALSGLESFKSTEPDLG